TLMRLLSGKPTMETKKRRRENKIIYSLNFP
ncbi:MAG: hypothetical protein ACI95X_002960, partial [Paraglaciecola sp.]